MRFVAIKLKAASGLPKCCLAPPTKLRKSLIYFRIKHPRVTPYRATGGRDRSPDPPPPDPVTLIGQTPFGVGGEAERRGYGARALVNPETLSAIGLYPAR